MTDSTIPVGFKDRFHDDYIMLSQQRESRLVATIRTDPDMLVGRFGYFDRIGSIEMQDRTSRHQDTGTVEVPHSRRRITTSDKELPILLDKQDVMRLVNSPQGKYMELAIAAANRKKDKLLITAATANSYSIDEDMNATPIALPAGQQIAAGGTGMTLAKLLQVREILLGNEAVMYDGATGTEEMIYGIITSKQVTNLLNTTEVKNADYNSVKALAEGKIDTFLGIKFIRSELLIKASTTRTCLFYTKNAIGLAVGEDITVDIGPRRDKGNAQQLLVTMSMDATRIEDEKLVQCDCTES